MKRSLKKALASFEQYHGDSLHLTKISESGVAAMCWAYHCDRFNGSTVIHEATSGIYFSPEKLESLKIQNLHNDTQLACTGREMYTKSVSKL
jgi:hypothetical protein